MQWSVATFAILVLAAFAEHTAQPINSVVELAYLRCAFHSGKLLHRDKAFVDSHGELTACRSNATNPCELEWIEDTETFNGLDSVILVGDSTLLRLAHFLVKAPQAAYEERVANLKDDYLRLEVVLSSGRVLPLHFFRALHVLTSIEPISRAFELATANSLIILTFGPHDTSWLVFRKPMPGFKKTSVGNWNHAKAYWNRHVTMMMQYVARRLQLFEQNGGGNLSKSPIPHAPTTAFSRPVIVFREQFLANCAHPKYTKYPLITRCHDLLTPIVIPHYRAYMLAMASTVNIPVVGIDELLASKVCHFVDAGHVNRECHQFEWQLLVQAFRSTRRHAVLQGYRVGGSSQHFQILAAADIGVQQWDVVSDLVALVPPAGYATNLFLRRQGDTKVSHARLSLHDSNTSLHQRTPLLSGAQRVFVFNLEESVPPELDVRTFQHRDLHAWRSNRCSRRHIVRRVDAPIESTERPGELAENRLAPVDSFSETQRQHPRHLLPDTSFLVAWVALTLAAVWFCVRW